MRKIALAIVAGFVFNSTVFAAGELNLEYRFKAGESLKYSYSEETSISQIMNGEEAPPITLKVETDFVLKTVKLNSDGADVVFKTNGFKIYQDGKLIASTNKLLPQDVGEAQAHMKFNGEVVFYRMISVIMHEQVPYLIVKESKDGMTSISTDEDTITASVAGMIVEGGFKKVTRTVTFEESDAQVDTTPKLIAQFFTLPEGDVRQAQSTSIKSPGGVTFTYSSLLKSFDSNTGIATLNLGLKTKQDKNQDDFFGQAMSLDISADVKFVFDSKKGQLLEISTQNYKTTTEMMGMGFKSKTKMALKVTN